MKRRRRSTQLTFCIVADQIKNIVIVNYYYQLYIIISCSCSFATPRNRPASAALSRRYKQPVKRRHTLTSPVIHEVSQVDIDDAVELQEGFPLVQSDARVVRALEIRDEVTQVRRAVGVQHNRPQASGYFFLCGKQHISAQIQLRAS